MTSIFENDDSQRYNACSLRHRYRRGTVRSKNRALKLSETHRKAFVSISTQPRRPSAGSNSISMLAIVLSGLLHSPLSKAGTLPEVPLPASLENIVIHASWPPKTWCNNALAEGNNIDARGPIVHSGVFPKSGLETAAAWTALLNHSRGVFALRDSLFSQQDHPIAQASPKALMFPPNWIAAVVQASAEHRTMALPTTPDPGKNASWELLTQDKLFGDFPKSATLYEWSTKKSSSTKPMTTSDRARMHNARTTMIWLRDLSQQLVTASAKGPEAVAQLAAAFMTTSDAAYFGPELRRSKLIPIFVENPTDFERSEGKGLDPSFETRLNPDLHRLLAKAIYGARLDQGDLALERYDLTNASDRQRAVDLALLLTKDSAQSSHLWIWVTGKLDPHKKLQGENATAYVKSFRDQLTKAGANMSRIKILSKPVAEPPKNVPLYPWVEQEAQRYRQLGLPMTVNFTCEQLLPSK